VKNTLLPAAFGIAVLSASLIVTGCGEDDGAPTMASTRPAPTTNVSAGATTTPAAATPRTEREVEADAYDIEPVWPLVRFERMIEFALIPGNEDHALLITQDGTVRRFSLVDDGLEPQMFLDIRDKIIPSPGNEEGLLGIAMDPNYEQNRRFYVYYSAGPPRRTVLEGYVAGGDVADPTSDEVLLEIEDPFSNHNGGGLEFGPDGYLYLAVGDGGSGGDPQGNGQDTDALLGKILRLDVSGASGYAIPPDNPFAIGGGRPEIFAYGFRNPWRITFDRGTGDLWTGDVGQGTREEVDLVERGGNYGWSIMEGDLCFQPREDCDPTGLMLPRATYGTRDGGNCAVTGGYVYRGSTMPELRGWYVYADYCAGVVWALDTENEAAEPVRLVSTGHTIPSFGEDADGELYLITFEEQIVRLVRP
jgi:glucose/arabinose dehydrogenase